MPSHADPALSATYHGCMDKAGGATASMLECMDQEYRLLDSRLNAAYQTLLMHHTGPRKLQLRDAQRTWLKFRDANCSYYADPDGGSLARVIGSDCLLTVTAARVDELEGLLQ
ncbi:lysozyme inhibitor LprI family protein [Chitinolyticbacter meiyuanensis]|uniref:lysozyme inhibitor LprI family protein n=1 Tax=Chitinolyticbacter meiyuanensis TaxID=682798 RepID=UPI0011E5F200|nr:lysozyme inhibitor LprI family protein [Chitinolyticbacter meiyuanensis]